MDADDDYKSALGSEDYLDFLVRQLNATERHVAILEDDWPGNPTIYKYRQLCIELRRQVEEASVLDEHMVQGFWSCLNGVVTEFRKTFESRYYKDNPEKITDQLNTIAKQKIDAFNAKEKERRREFFQVRNEWLKHIRKRRADR